MKPDSRYFSICVRKFTRRKVAGSLSCSHIIAIRTMWGTIFVLSAVACLSLGAPQEAVTQAVQIVAQNSAINADGSFNHSFEASNGIKVEESGYVKPSIDVRGRLEDTTDGDNGGDIQVIQGSFSYTAPDGTPISVKYVADETGFHPEGTHLPTPPPIPEAIQRALSALPDTSSDKPSS